MNSTVSAVHDRHGHPPPIIHPRPTRQVDFIDRLALHIGLALITWGRRRQQESRERRANRVEQALAQREREWSAERNFRLGIPPR